MVDENIFRTRPDAMSLKGVTATSSLQASLIGSRIMERGGNVVDAAIASSAALCVTQNNLCGLGGDMFALVRMDGKGITDYNGSGRSFSRASIEHSRISA
jgi:gamma-glutamyltransferase 2. Threonine peptidase. MEROPS family T03